ncbi:MAG: T9SS type A sorting domain-containing protein, partial [Bacteroidota bacterium]
QEDELDIEASFKRYRMEELQDGDSLYFIDNRGRELYRAFRALNDVAVSKKDGVLLKRLSEPDSDESGFAERLTSTSKIGPNPFLDVLSLQFFEEIPGEVRLLSIDGKLIRKTIPTAPQIDWPLTDLEAGIYLLQWVDPSSNKLETYKVIKQ